MSQRRATILCQCGRGRIFSGENRKYNAVNAQGKQVCPECKLDEFYSRLRNNG